MRHRNLSPRSLVALVLGVVVLASPACNGKSPTAPAGGGAAGLTVAFDDPGGLLGGRAVVIRQELEAVFAAASPLISIDGVVARVNPDLGRVVPGWGVGGFAHGPNEIEIAVDPALAEATLVERLPWIAAHEFHHAARFRGPGYGGSLLQAIASEGLADHFAFELYGPPEAPWAVALDEAELPIWIERARPELDSTTFDFDAWFFGVGGEMPRWTGYAIGFHLVAQYKAANPGTTAASLVNASADAFRPD